ncbi:MAG: peptide-methionine (S)-S-oxide reductase MsrA [Rhizobiales bacterium]|nr:peptide-methionine (S)-S-oxide reductase MsrA [Hyphomicrobiales bacterium]
MPAFIRLIPVVVALLIAAAPGMAQSAAPQQEAKTATAIFAGGCFWCVESDFDKVKGVVSTTSGYTGGHVANPTYQQVSAGGTGHAEAVKVVYDPAQVSYAELLRVFWRTIDPLAKDRQFCDAGDQYRTAIFVANADERRAAEATKAEVAKRFGQPVATQIVDAGTFYPAEDYHQDYYLKNPTKYKFYRWNCGRDQRLKELWGSEAGGHTS